MTLPPWIHSEHKRDNWQGGPWDRAIQARALEHPGHAADDHFWLGVGGILRLLVQSQCFNSYLTSGAKRSTVLLEMAPKRGLVLAIVSFVIYAHTATSQTASLPTKD